MYKPPRQVGEAARARQRPAAPRGLDQVVHSRQFGIQQLVVVAHFQQLGVRYLQHVDHVGVAARFIDEGAVPGEHHQIVGVIGIAVAQQVARGTFRQRALLAGQQGDEVETIGQRLGGHRFAEGVGDADKVILFQGRRGGPDQRIADALPHAVQKLGP